MSDRHHPYLRGSTNKARAHALLDGEMRERILDVFPIKDSQRRHEKKFLDRIARWIERLTLTAEKAPKFPTAKKRKQSVAAICSSAKVFELALLKADQDTKKRIYIFLSGSRGRNLGNFEGDNFTRGRKRYQQFLRGIRLAGTAAKQAIRPDGKGPKGTPLVEAMEVLKDIWLDATDYPFSYSAKPKKDKSRKADQSYHFVLMVLDIADEVAARAGRKTQPLGGSSKEGSIRNAIKVAQKSTGLRTDNRSKKTMESDRNTYRIR